MVLEILGTRIIAPYFGTTLYVWTALIVITLLALALGYFFGGRLADKKPVWKIFYSLFFIVSILFLLIPLVDGFILDITSSLGIMWGPLVAALLLFFLPLSMLGMITPFAVRLRTKVVENVGKRVGNFYAISTVGSIVGALAVAYCLIPNFKISVILYGSAGVLFLVSAIWFIFNKKGTIATISVLLVGILLVIMQPAEKAEANVLEHVQSFYGDITVEIISTDLTCILVNNIPEICYNPDIDGSAMPYTKVMATGLDRIDNPEKVLIIGDGGGLTVHEILKKYSPSIDVVDIDKHIFELGKKYLGFIDRSNVEKIVADGRSYLHQSDTTYDAILIDLLLGSSLVPNFYSQESFQLAQSKLNKGGILVVNSYGFNRGEGFEIIQAIKKTLDSVFPYVAVNSTSNIETEDRFQLNYIFFVSDSELPELGRIVNIDIPENTSLITDDFNQVEYFSLPISEEFINYYVFGSDE